MAGENDKASGNSRIIDGPGDISSLTKDDIRAMFEPDVGSSAGGKGGGDTKTDTGGDKGGAAGTDFDNGTGESGGDNKGDNKNILDGADVIGDLMGENTDTVSGDDKGGRESDAAHNELDELQKSMNEKQGAAFKRLREEIAELKKAGTTGHNAEEVEQLRTDLADARKQIKQMDITRDPEFKSAYDAPLDAARERIRNTLKEFGKNPDAIMHLERMPLRQRLSTIRQSVPDAYATLQIQFERLDQLSDERNAAIHRADATTQAMSGKAAEQVDSAMNKALLALRNESHFPLMESAKNEEWQKGVTSRITSARKLMESRDTATRAEMALKAVSADAYKEIVTNQRSIITELKQQLAKFTNARASLGGGAGGGSNASTGRKKHAEDIAAGRLEPGDAFFAS